MFMSLLALPAFSQNTKGDRPEVSGSSGKRESRFKSPFKKKNKNQQASFNRAQPRGVTRANSGRKPPKAGKASQKIYPQRNLSTQPNNTQRAMHGGGAPRVRVRSNTGKTRNVYPQYGRYSNNPSRKPQTVQKPVSNKSTLARLKKLQGPSPSGPGKKKKVVPRSASRSFTARKSINVYANFPRPKRKGERAVTTDIAGRPLRRKNYETPRVTITNPTARPYHARKRVGDQPYRGPSGGYRSATRTTPKAWKGNISGHKIRGRNFSSKKRVEGQPILPKRSNNNPYGDRAYRGTVPGNGARSASQPGEKRTGKSPLPVRVPGQGADRIGRFQGNIKGHRPLKGGGSVSGRSWNNKGVPVPVRTPQQGARAATFQGNIKGHRPDKGGGSVSGRSWNNKGVPVPVRTPQQGARAATFQGNIKGHRPLKGGGSVSGKLWNNKGTPLPGKQPSADAMKVGGYPGRIRRFEQSPGFSNQGEEFTGSLKGRKRAPKGGGSVSGKLWNNKESAIPVRPPSAAGRRVSGYPGKIRRFEVQPGFNNQGEEFTGNVKRPWFWKDYIENDNAAKASIKKKRPTSATYQVGELQQPVRQREYVRNKNAAEEALLKQKPTSNTYKVGDLQVRMKQREYGKKPNGAEGSLPGIKPTKETVKASTYAKGARRTFDYVRNPASHDEALKVREPGKAFAKSTDYQGNIKMQKYQFFERNRHLHPDAQFIKTNKNNVDGERDLLTNFKLWWARLFKKEETQPDHLKDKGHKPRYDKGEEGLWYD